MIDCHQTSYLGWVYKEVGCGKKGLKKQGGGKKGQKKEGLGISKIREVVKTAKIII